MRNDESHKLHYNPIALTYGEHEFCEAATDEMYESIITFYAFYAYLQAFNCMCVITYNCNCQCALSGLHAQPNGSDSAVKRQNDAFATRY